MGRLTSLCNPECLLNRTTCAISLLSSKPPPHFYPYANEYSSDFSVLLSRHRTLTPQVYHLALRGFRSEGFGRRSDEEEGRNYFGARPLSLQQQIFRGRSG
ncbi:hypothetical protein PROFUN_01900 [Planoprotostelium fungivorum]|uniref:Uncharacterized protein n=1 Tax=Planoprotostelium fungivorum TaxID=1890364 RepID=A0A2P6NZ05_9EUKA|nr:hypothetical protein PROFUN_01900 [Planoprotostelium fungivorum]